MTIVHPAITAALSLSWWQRWLLQRAIKAILKRLNKVGRGCFTRQLAFEIRQQIIGEIMRQIEWAKTKTPDFEIDEQALQCAAWVLESDTLQRTINHRTGANTDVHARWGVPSHPSAGPAADRAQP